MPGIAWGTSVNLSAPATDPVGLQFSYWTLNEVTQPAGQKELNFEIAGDSAAVAVYDIARYTLT